VTVKSKEENGAQSKLALTSRRFIASSHEWHLRFILHEKKTSKSNPLHSVRMSNEWEMDNILLDGNLLSRIQFDGQHHRTVGTVTDPAQDAIPVHCFRHLC
jgi:hypothetical protein